MKPTERHRDPLCDAADGDSLITHYTEILEIPYVYEDHSKQEDYFRLMMREKFVPDSTPPCRISDLPAGLRTREALRQALLADCTADPRTGQPGTFTDLLEWIQLANFPDLPPEPKQRSGKAPMRCSDLPPAVLPGNMKAVQLELDKHRLAGAVCDEIFSGNMYNMGRLMLLFVAELRLVRKLLWARCCAGDDSAEDKPARLQYTYALMSMFWQDMVWAAQMGIRLTDGGPDAYGSNCASTADSAGHTQQGQDLERSLVRTLELLPAEGDGWTSYVRHILIYASKCTPGQSRVARDRQSSNLVSHLCAIRQREWATGTVSPSTTDIAERNPHDYGLTALTAPLLNMSCDGFHACIAFHLPLKKQKKRKRVKSGQSAKDSKKVGRLKTRPGKMQQTCYWAQARNEEEFVLYMLLTLPHHARASMLLLKEGATIVTPQESTGARDKQLSQRATVASMTARVATTRGANRQVGKPNLPKPTWLLEARHDRWVAVEKHFEGQKHTSSGLKKVVFSDGMPVWLELNSDLLFYRDCPRGARDHLGLLRQERARVVRIGRQGKAAVRKRRSSVRI
jgi:hypothetical protein